MEGIKMLKALRSKLRAEVEYSTANLDIYMDKSVGIGDHGDILGVVDGLVEEIANAVDKLNTVNFLIDDYSNIKVTTAGKST